MMRKRNYLAAITLLLLAASCSSGLSQTQSEYALIREPVFEDPMIWKLTRSVTNTYWEIDLFSSPRSSAQSYIMTPWHELWSGVSFHLDNSWNRMVYFECLDNWIRAYGGYGTGTGQFWWPKSLDAVAPCDDTYYSPYYYIYVADTQNDRIVRLIYDWEYQTMADAGSYTGGGLDRPGDLDLNDGGDFFPHTNDYIWLLNGPSQIKRFTVDGVLHSSFGDYGCDGQDGQFCRLTGIVSGRSAFMENPYANNDHFYVADAGNNRIVWLTKWPGAETVSWMGSIPTSSSIVDLEMDSFGQLWALDQDAGTITKYTYDLFPLCTFGTSGTGENQFWRPFSISTHGGYLGLGSMFVMESWSDSSGGQYFSIGTDIVDFSVGSSQNEHWHYITYVLVDPSDVTIEIYDDQRGLVKTLFDGAQFSGPCYFVWDGSDDSGQQAATGDYRVALVDTCGYGDVETGTPVNVVSKEAWIHHVYNPYTDYTPGDMNDDGSLDIADLVYLVDYMFAGGPPPQPFVCVGNVDADGSIDIADLVLFVDWMFAGGPAPEDGCHVRGR